MFATNTFIALLAFAVPFFVRADVTPTVPAPGAVYNAGSPCSIAWTGDSNSSTIWKNMAIQLMAGSNLDMQPITTVATGQDGTVSGKFTYTCPEVTPNSPIYFYQFSSPKTANLQWTGRFAIASSSGQTTPPANDTQPDGSPIPWGMAQLVNPSLAVPPPSFVSSTGASMVSSSTSMLNSTSSTSIAASSTVSPTSVLLTSVPSSSSESSSTTLSSPTAQGTPSGASAAMIAFDIRVWGAAAAATLALSFVW